MEIKEIIIRANTPKELEVKLKKETESGEWQFKAIMKDSPGVFWVTLGK